MQLAPKPAAKAIPSPLWLAVLVLVMVLLGLWGLHRGPGLPQAYAYKYPSLLAHRAKTRSRAYQDEIAFYQKRIAANPDSGLDLAALASTYLKKARVTGQGSWYLLAEQAAQRSLAALPVYNAGATLALAEVAQARHDFGGALVLIGRVLEAQPNNSSAISLRSTVYLATGQPVKAWADADRLVKEIPNLTNLVLRALAEEARGQESQAVKDFRQALVLEEPDDPFGSARARTLLGRYYARHGQLELAAGLYAEALRIAPYYPQAVLLRADLESRLGDYRAAEADYNALLGGHAALGNQSQGSGTIYDHAASRGLARIRRVQKSPDEASYWDRTEGILRFEIENGAFGHRRELARLLLERGRPQDLEEALQQAQIEAKTRRDWETLSALAWAQMESGQLQAAWQTVQEALRTGIKDAELFYRAGQIERALGNQAGAQRYFWLSLETDSRFDAKARALIGVE